MSVELQILAAVRDATTIACRDDKDPIQAFDPVRISDFPRTPAASHGILGRKEEEHLEVTYLRLDLFRGPTIGPVRHRRVLPVDVDLPSISMEVALQPLGDFGIEVAVAQNAVRLFCALPSLADFLTVE